MEPIKVPDMMCNGCVATINEALGKVAGVESVSTDLEQRTVTVAGSADRGAVIEAIRKAGYKPE